MKALHLTLATSLLIVLAGCTTRGGVETAPPVEDRTDTSASGAEAAEAPQESAQASGVAPATGFQGDVLDDPASPLSQRVVYFEHDSSEIKSEYQDLLRAHGEYLATHPNARLLVEGHTDERGSREYNLALGEQRADAVKRVLVLNGAAADQVERVSFGEEKPAQAGSDDAAMAQNRRAELAYTQR
jgi:peptidoglycan-associated lipoprotein